MSPYCGPNRGSEGEVGRTLRSSLEGGCRLRHSRRCEHTAWSGSRRSLRPLAFSAGISRGFLALCPKCNKHPWHLCGKVVTQQKRRHPGIVLDFGGIDHTGRLSAFERNKKPFPLGSLEISIDSRELHTSIELIGRPKDGSKVRQGPPRRGNVLSYVPSAVRVAMQNPAGEESRHKRRRSFAIRHDGPNVSCG